MRHRHAVPLLLFLAAGTPFVGNAAAADAPVTLMGTIAKWGFPEARIGEATMFDAATVDAEGNRTVPSTAMKTTMVTAAPVEEVLAYYRDLLKPGEASGGSTGAGADAGRSVIFSDESEGRPFAFHTILVNTGNRSTTLIITRGQGEGETHITWKQYLRHDAGG